MIATAKDWKPGKPNGCKACFIYFVWHLVPWVRHTCRKGMRYQRGKTDEELRPTPAPEGK